MPLGKNRTIKFLFLTILSALLLLASVFLWKSREARNIEEIYEQAASKGRAFAGEAEIQFKKVYESLERLASRGAPADLREFREFEKDAEFYIDAFDGITLIALVDRNFRIERVFPASENGDRIGDFANTFGEETGELKVWVPVREGNLFQGYIFGIIDLEAFFLFIHDEIEEHYNIFISNEGTPLYQHGTWESEPSNPPFTTSINFENTAVIDFSILPAKGLLRRSKTDALKILFFSLGFSVISIIAMYFAQNYSRQAVSNRAFYQNLFDSSKDAIFIINMEGEYWNANPAALDMTGYTKDELLRMREEDLQIKPIVPRTSMEKLWKEGGGVRRTLRKKDGTPFTVEMSISPLQALEEPDLVLGIARDVTVKEKTERELEEYRNRLEELVRDRTQALENINRELNDFAYIVSHDLKAPLRGINQIAKWLADDYGGSLDAEGRKLLDLLSNRTVRMHDLITGILEYSRIGRMKGKETIVDISILVSEVIDLLNMPENIRVAVRQSLPDVLADRTAVFQVFQNLIGNAVKFMDKKEGTIEIRCKDDGREWIFSVHDNGPGINEKYFEKIFQIFQTLTTSDQAAVESRESSTGLGLALVKKIVDTWGGKVWVKSELDNGSIFYFSIPKKG